ncbi:MAG: hypothetical protein HGA65_11630, partial [Oscillochloris sp.]|nr:hypothetical protein [Oscillochloris sp.]
ALVVFGLHLSAEEVLRGMLARLPAQVSGEVRAIADVATLLLAYSAELRGQQPQLDLPDLQSIHSLPAHRLAMRDAALATYAFLLHARGEFARAEALLLASAVPDSCGQALNAVPVAAARLARIWVAQGRLAEAAALCQGVLAQTPAHEQRRFALGGSLHLVLGDVLREQGDLEQAEREIRCGIALNAAWPSPEPQLIGALLLARVLLARADLTSASEALRAADRLHCGYLIAPEVLSELQSVRVQLWLAQGDLAAAGRWAGDLDPHPPLVFRHERDQITRARVLLAQGAVAEAHVVLSRWREAAGAGGRQGRLIEIMLLNALALAGLSRRAEALAELAASRALAVPAGYRRIFLDEGPRLAALLEVGSGSDRP